MYSPSDPYWSSELGFALLGLVAIWRGIIGLRYRSPLALWRGQPVAMSMGYRIFVVSGGAIFIAYSIALALGFVR